MDLKQENHSHEYFKRKFLWTHHISHDYISNAGPDVNHVKDFTEVAQII